MKTAKPKKPAGFKYALSLSESVIVTMFRSNPEHVASALHAAAWNDGRPEGMKKRLPLMLTVLDIVEQDPRLSVSPLIVECLYDLSGFYPLNSKRYTEIMTRAADLALKFSPKGDSFRWYLASNAAEAYVKQGHLELAERYFRQSLENFTCRPKEKNLWMPNLIFIYFGLAQCAKGPEAEKYLAKANKLSEQAKAEAIAKAAGAEKAGAA